MMIEQKAYVIFHYVIVTCACKMCFVIVISDYVQETSRKQNVMCDFQLTVEDMKIVHEQGVCVQFVNGHWVT